MKITQLQEKLTNFYSNNRFKIYLLLFSLFIGIIVSLSLKYKYEKKNNLISNKYTQAVLYLSNKDYEDANQIFDEIILSKNKFYSILAINAILENDLIKDKNEILKYFDILEKIKFSQENQDLIALKKALYLMKTSKEEEGKKILDRLIKINSIWKEAALEILNQDLIALKKLYI